ncbi:MAG: FAD:protein FMN transferase [Prevotella sp.]|nr:FAD:protein FMN transferase [Prevotella sp.]
MSEPSNNRLRRWWHLPFLLVLIIGTILIVRQHASMPYHHDRGMVFGTIYNITYQHSDNLKEEIEAALHQVDLSLSPFNKQSVISHINDNSDMKTDEMFREVFELSKHVSEATGGAFDITVAPLVNAWGFGFKQGIDPERDTIDSLLQLVGYDKVSINRQGHLTKTDPRVMLDCSAVAKGYGCDIVARLLRNHDVENFMIEIGGEIVVRGQNDRGQSWRIGVSKPVDDTLLVNTEQQAILSLTNRALATSGNYRNFYYKGGKKYAHTINPKTGYPVDHNLLSATVIARDCATADAWATAFMVLGADRAKELLSEHNELEAYLISAAPDGSYVVWYSPSLEKKLQP